MGRQLESTIYRVGDIKIGGGAVWLRPVRERRCTYVIWLLDCKILLHEAADLG